MFTSGLEFNESLFRDDLLLREVTPSDINNTNDIGGMTPLHWLCLKHLYCDTIRQQESNLQLIENLLVFHGADPNIMTSTLSYTPLHILSLGKNSEEKEISNIWTFLKDKIRDEHTNINEELAIKTAVRVLLENGARIIPNRTHNLTPLGLFMMRLGKEDMEIENVYEFFPVSLRLRDLFEMNTIKLCEFRNREVLLKIVSLSIKHGYGYLGSLDWNVSGLSRLLPQDCDQLILVYTQGTFQGKLLPDYIPLVLNSENQDRNEIFPLKCKLLDEMKNTTLVYEKFGITGLKAALNLIICEESMYISFEEILVLYSTKLSDLSMKNGLEPFEEMFSIFVDVVAERFRIKTNTKSMNTVGSVCLLILLELLGARKQDKHIVKRILSSLIAKYEMNAILHSIVDVMSCNKTQYLVITGERSHKLANFKWKTHIEIILEFLDTQINNLDEDGNTCLFVAINNMDIHIITELLTHNAYPYARNTDGNTCILLIRDMLTNVHEVSPLRQKIDLLDSSPPMLKVLSAELIISHTGLRISEDNLAASARNILVLHGYKFKN
ncbi:hypothetical protein LOD99_1220 [Oopsacas minuta]|uniref:Uncharacterized protein n=1 Tax=Oopsacas minuta TaxID=111878 RepID=A0AAV7K6L6_9METZ|nr:hypothetical protein LOD99_1220 [Oopsacas minuta]